MNKKLKLTNVMAVMAVSMLITSCGAVSQADYDKVVEERDYYKQKYEALTGTTSEGIGEPIPAEDNEFMEKCRNTTEIYLLFDADTEYLAGQKTYSLKLDKDGTHSTFYYSPDAETVDFSAEKFYELRDMLCSTPLKKYEPPTDENGKIIYETLDTAITVYFNMNEGNAIIADPPNKAEILAFFNSLLEAATN